MALNYFKIFTVITIIAIFILSLPPRTTLLLLLRSRPPPLLCAVITAQQQPRQTCQQNIIVGTNLHELLSGF